MAHKSFNRIRETATAPGTSSFTLNGAVQGAQTFGARLASTNRVWYIATNGTAWEVGYGTFTSPTTLARTTILESSNADAVVNFSSGTVDIFCALPASVTDALNLLQETLTCAATVDIGAAHAKFILLSGTTGPITSLGSVPNKERWVEHSGETINNNAAILLFGGINWVTAAGDISLFKSNASGVYKEYIRRYANGLVPIIYGGTGATTASAARTALGVSGAVSLSPDADTTLTAANLPIVRVGALTAPRTYTLPLANSVEAGRTLTVIDALAVTPTNTLTIQRQGSDGLYGFGTTAGTTFVLNIAGAGTTFVSDGVSTWFRVGYDFLALLRSDNLASLASIPTARTNLGLAIGTHVQAWDADLDKLSGIAPSFAVHRNSVNQTAIATGTFTKVQFTTEEFDTNSNFDNATNYRFTPTVPGKYLISFNMMLFSLGDGKVDLATIYKNGAAYKHGVPAPAGAAGNAGASVAHVIDFNGSTDYVEFYIYHEHGSNLDLSGLTGHTFASGIRIAS